VANGKNGFGCIDGFRQSAHGGVSIRFDGLTREVMLGNGHWRRGQTETETHRIAIQENLSDGQLVRVVGQHQQQVQQQLFAVLMNQRTAMVHAQQCDVQHQRHVN